MLPRAYLRVIARNPKLFEAHSRPRRSNWGALWEKLPELTRAAYVRRSHSKTDAEAREKAH